MDGRKRLKFESDALWLYGRNVIKEQCYVELDFRGLISSQDEKMG
jgi:hypothetical protein